MRDRFLAFALGVIQLAEALVCTGKRERVVVETAVPASRGVGLELGDRRVGLVREIECAAEIEVQTQRIFRPGTAVRGDIAAPELDDRIAVALLDQVMFAQARLQSRLP